MRYGTEKVESSTKIFVLAKIRDRRAKIEKYTITDENGELINISSDELKKLLYYNEVQAINVRLAENDRIIDKAYKHTEMGVEPLIKIVNQSKLSLLGLTIENQAYMQIRMSTEKLSKSLKSKLSYDRLVIYRELENNRIVNLVVTSDIIPETLSIAYEAIVKLYNKEINSYPLVVSGGCII